MSWAIAALLLIGTAYFTYLLGEAIGQFVYIAYGWLSSFS